MENKEFNELNTNQIELPTRIDGLDEKITEEKKELEKKIEKQENKISRYRIIILILILLLLISFAGNLYQYQNYGTNCNSNDKINNDNNNDSSNNKQTCSCDCLKEKPNGEDDNCQPENEPKDEEPENPPKEEKDPEDPTKDEDPKEPSKDEDPEEPSKDLDPTPEPSVSTGFKVEFGEYSITKGSVNGKITMSDDNLTLYHIETLQIPGDYFEFLVEVKNIGTIDAKLDEYVLSELTPNQDKYLNYTIKYSDNTMLNKGDVLLSGDVKTLKIRIEFEKDNITKEDLPTENDTLDSSLSLNYIEK